MFSCLISILWPLIPYIFIVCIGNYITGLMVLNTQSDTPSCSSQLDKDSSQDPKPDAWEERFVPKRKEEQLQDISTECDSEDHATNDNLIYKNNFYDTADSADSNITKIFNLSSNMSKFYVVNESVFQDLDPATVSYEEHYNYRLYKVMKTDGDADVHRNDDELSEDDLMESLFITEEIVEQGIVINNNVFLSNEQWNTIRRISNDLYSCTVCQLQCDALAVSDHVKTTAHAQCLNKHRPLKRFDLSIIRKIDDNFHCGVCNDIFPIASYRDHENLKSHEGNLLFSINKVSDIMWDNQENGTTQNYADGMRTQLFNANNIRDPDNAPAARNAGITPDNRYNRSWTGGNTQMRDRNSLTDRNTNMRERNPSIDRNTQLWERNPSLDRNTQLRDRNPSIDRNTQLRDRNPSIDRNTQLRDRYPSLDRNTQIWDRNHSLDRNTQMWDRNSESESMSPDLTKIFTNGIARSEQNFNFEKSLYNDVKIYEEDDIEEYTLPIEGVSYASMASKPRLNVPKFLKIDLGTKEVRVKYESWNMITQTNLNELYCMGCAKSLPMRQKTAHCMDDEHRKIIAKCPVVGAFEDYLIREISDKLYHCGHCNNLQYKNDIQVHVAKYHPIKNSKNLTEKPLSLRNDEVVTRNDGTVVRNDGTVVRNGGTVVRNDATEMNLMKAKFDIFGNFKFCPFGAEMSVPHLGCHTIMPLNNKYLCAICDVYIQGDLKEHVYEATHMRLINMTPFIRPFQCNLTRAVRGSLHCAICNILIPVKTIYDHNIETSHTNALARALGMTKKERPMQDIKYQPDEPTEFKTDMDRFLSTLPPDTRGALSMFKIKNPKGELFQLCDTSSSSTSTSSNNTPRNMSLNNSPKHKTDTLKEPVPKIGAVDIKQSLEARYPKGAEDKRDSLACYPKSGPNRPDSPAGRSGAESKLNATYPKGGLEGIIPLSYPPCANNLTSLPQFKTGQMLTVSMIESGLTGTLMGSPMPVQLQVTGPLDHTVNNGVGIPVQPIRRQENIDLANGLAMSRNQSPARHKVNELGLRENLDNLPEKKEVRKGVGKTKGQERTASETNKPEVKKKKVTVDSDDEEIPPFELEETVFLKHKSSYFKVTATSYHSLVHMGDGSRHCFVCASRVRRAALRRHVAGRHHADNLAKNKFLYNFCGQLFRQMYLTYHCAICNVTMYRKELKMHLEWRTHIDNYELSCKKFNKKDLRDAIKSGAKELSVETQKEFIYVISEPVLSVVTYVQSLKDDCQEVYVQKKLERKCQLIILKGNMMKISFESWHGVLVTKSGVKCIICQQELSEDGLQGHLETEYHRIALGMTFEKQFYPTLIRKVNKNTVNCVICNLELPNDDSLVFEHINGRKHDKNYNAIIDKSSHTDSYSDCYKYPVTL